MKIATSYTITRNGGYRGRSVSFDDRDDILRYMEDHPEIRVLSFGPGRVGLKRDAESGEISAFCGH